MSCRRGFSKRPCLCRSSLFFFLCSSSLMIFLASSAAHSYFYFFFSCTLLYVDVLKGFENVSINIDGLAQDCSSSIALAMKLQQSCTELLIIYCLVTWCCQRLYAITQHIEAKRKWHFTDNIFKCIFLNKRSCILIKVHWNLCPRLQLTMSQRLFKSAWCQTDGKVWFDPMMA